MRPRLRIALLPLFFLAPCTLFLLTACLSKQDPGEWARGSVLTINVSHLQALPQVEYTSQGKHFIIRPSAANQRLAVAKVLLRNDRSAQVTLLINEKAGYLSDRSYNRLGPIDPFARGQEVVQQSPESGKSFTPFLWGKLDIPQGFQIEGWMVFEVPQGFLVDHFEWDQADTIRLPIKGDF